MPKVMHMKKKEEDEIIEAIANIMRAYAGDKTIIVKNVLKILNLSKQ